MIAKLFAGKVVLLATKKLTEKSSLQVSVEIKIFSEILIPGFEFLEWVREYKNCKTHANILLIAIASGMWRHVHYMQDRLQPMIHRYFNILFSFFVEYSKTCCYCL